MRYVQWWIRLYQWLRRLFPVWGGRRLVEWLLVKANRLSVHGFPEAATHAAQEAVDEGARIATFDPERHSAALSGLAQLLVWRGRYDEALAVTDRIHAVAGEVRTAAAPLQGDLLTGWCMVARSGLLQRQGRHDEALDAAVEAVRLFRIHLPLHPRKCRAGLAAALKELGHRYSERSRHADAIDAFREANRLYKRLGRVPTGRWIYPQLETGAALAVALGAAGDWQAALRQAGLVTDVLRLLVRRGREGFRPNLALLLQRSAAWHQERGDSDAAVRTAAEAVEHYRILTDRDPDTYQMLLVASQHNLVNRRQATARIDSGKAVRQPGTLIGQFLRAVMLRQDEKQVRLREEIERNATADDLKLARIAFGIALRHYLGPDLDRRLVDAFLADLQQPPGTELPLPAIAILVRRECGDDVSTTDIDAGTEAYAFGATLVIIADLLDDVAAVDTILTQAETAASDRGLHLHPTSTEDQ